MALSIDSLKRQSPERLLIAVNVAIWAICFVASIFGAYPARWLSLPSGLGALALRPWALLTYMFTQVEFFHLLFNMLWLYWFAGFFMTLGNGRQLVMTYICGGLSGALVYIVCGLTGIVGGGELCGSSASVLAVVVAAACMVPHLRINLFLIGSVEIRWLAVAAVVLSLIALGGSNTGGNLAHLGGAIFGIGFALKMKGLGRKRFRIVKPAKQHDEDEDDNATLDRLLDKVRRSGYSSLNSAERKKLIELSNKL